MAFYGMDYPAALKLPLTVFWMLSNNINRITAERDQRQLQLLASVNSSDDYKRTQRALTSEIGQIAREVEPEPAPGVVHPGIAQLRGIFSR